MAWRPHQYLLEGELDNTTPGKVTGWMRFAGIKDKVTFDLKGDFHRDIRGAKIHFSGDGNGADREEAAKYMESFATHQTGNVGDITAGLPPRDYSAYPYFEWYSQENGRVVIELEPEQVQVIGQPIPWQESDPVSREKQRQNMDGFVAGLSQALGVPTLVVDGQSVREVNPSQQPGKQANRNKSPKPKSGNGTGLGPNLRASASDADFSHWVIVEGQFVGEAHSVRKIDDLESLAFVRLFAMPAMAEFGNIANNQLLAKEL